MSNISNEKHLDGALSKSYKVKRQRLYYDDELTLFYIWNVLNNYKWLIVFISLFGGFIATTFAFIMTPIYKSDVVMVPSSKEAGRGGLTGLASQYAGLASLAGVEIPSGSNTNTSIAILKSRKFLTTYVNDNNLKPKLFIDRWDEENKNWIMEQPSIIKGLKKIIVPKKQFDIRDSSNLLPNEPNSWEVFELFNEILSVSEDKTNGLVSLSIEWTDPFVAAELANALVQRINEEMRLQAISDGERSIDYLKQQLDKTSISDLKTVLWRLVEENIKNITLAKTNDQFAFRIIDPAVPPDKRIKPNRTIMIALGLIMGFIFGLFIAFTRNFIVSLKERV